MKKLKVLFASSIFLVFLLYAWVGIETISPKIPSISTPTIFYSNQCRQDLRSTILKALKSAKKSIHLVMFGLKDEIILDQLAKNIESGIDLKLFYDKRHSAKNIFIKKNVYPVSKKSSLMHQKILVLDDQTVFLGSANMTKQSFSMHKNMILGFYSPEIAKFLSQKTPFQRGYISSMVGNPLMEIWLLPDKRNLALYNLNQIIKSAKKKIDIAMFTLTHPSIVNEVIKAHKKGVDVNIIIDSKTYLGASFKAIEKLKKEKIKIFKSMGPEIMHHKYLYIDEKLLVCGSFNATKAAFQKNKDIMLVLHDLTTNQKKFMNKLQRIGELEAI